MAEDLAVPFTSEHDSDETPRADVLMIGRLGSKVARRELPSGDAITVFSVIVDRPRHAIRGQVKVDTIACQASRSRIADRVARLEPGVLIRVEGVLRRRFWRAGGSLASAMEVDVMALRILEH